MDPVLLGVVGTLVLIGVLTWIGARMAGAHDRHERRRSHDREDTPVIPGLNAPD